MPSPRGQSTVELLAIAPALVALLSGAGQGVAAGWTFVEASDAARAGARAAAMGGDGELAARRALPSLLRTTADITVDDARVVVRVEAPRLVPAVPLGVEASAVR